MSKIISHPNKRYSKRENFSYLFLLKILNKVPIIDKIRTVKNIVKPEYSYNVIKHTGA